MIHQYHELKKFGVEIIRTEWLLYIIYILIITFKYLQQQSLCINNLNLLLPSFENISIGYVDSIIMCFHRAFTCSTIYKLLQDNCHKNHTVL